MLIFSLNCNRISFKKKLHVIFLCVKWLCMMQIFYVDINIKIEN